MKSSRLAIHIQLLLNEIDFTGFGGNLENDLWQWHCNTSAALGKNFLELSKNTRTKHFPLAEISPAAHVILTRGLKSEGFKCLT